ncbi:hypothetical protein GGF31_001233, partial [Allomyces arbusculus]
LLAPLPYTLPNGYSLELRCYVTAFTSPTKFFANVSIQVHGDTAFVKDWGQTLAAADAAVIESVASSNGGGLRVDPAARFVLLQPLSKLTKRLGSLTKAGEAVGTKLVTMEWVIQCLINQRVLNPMRMPQYHF